MAARRISFLLSRSAPLLSRGGKQSYTSRGIFQYTTAAAALEEPIKPPVSVQYDKLLINGQFADAASGKNFPSLDPRTGEVITHVPEGDAEDINRAVLAARKAFDEGPWPKMTAYVTKYPRVFGVQNRLKPLLDEFRDLGFSPNEVRREVLREPKVLGLENGELSHCVEMLRTLKCRAAIKDQIFRNGEFRAGYEAKLRIDCLRKHGLIYRDAFTVLWKEPRVIIYEVGDIEKKIAFLVNTMKFDIRCIVEVPEYLGVNFEKQIVPRFNVIEYLRSSDGLGDEVGLRNLVKMSRLRFYNMYVKPYPECEKMYERFCGDAVVGNGNRNRNRHPVGMWKLFKPEPNPESDDDVEIIKLYMESLHQEKMEHYQGVKKVESK